MRQSDEWFQLSQVRSPKLALPKQSQVPMPSSSNPLQSASIPLDTLHINGIRAYGYTGALPEEQVLGQWFSTDITLWLDLDRAAESDRLDDTRDYSAIVTDTLDLIRTSRFALIEKLAGAIANLCLRYDDVNQVRVQLTKEVPPIPDFSGHITVDITRQKTK